MSFRNCIVEARGAAGSDDERAAFDLATETYDEVFDGVRGMFGDVEADRQAADAAMKALETEKLEAQRRRALMIRTRRRAIADVAALKRARGYEGVRDVGGGERPPKGPDGWHQGGTPREDGPKAQAARALELIIENKPGLSGKAGWSVQGNYEALRGRFDAMMAAAIERFETRSGFDRPGRAVLENLRREAFGLDTGDQAAKAILEAWQETAETARQMFNAAGGAIGKLDDWRFPQWHDPDRVRAMGRDAWVDFIMPLLNRDRMIDRATGRAFTEARLRATLNQTWERIVSRGAAARPPGSGVGRGMLAKQRGEERFLIFLDAEGHRTYAAQLGEPDLYAAMMIHLDEMARDIAQMNVLGPNPAHQFEWLKNWAQREAALEEAAGAVGAITKANSYVQTAENMLGHFDGSLSSPVNPKLAGWGVGVRSFLTGTMLGSAILSDVPNAAHFGRMARAFTGLDRTGDMGRLMALLNPADGSARKIARRSGFIIEQATDGFVRATQDNLRLLTVGASGTGGQMNAFARRLPAFTLRTQLLTPYNAARKRSFRFELMGALNDVKGRTLADLAQGSPDDRLMATWLEARGFTEDEWAIIGATPDWTPAGGAAFLRPTDVPDAALGLRLAEAIQMETRFAAPETTLWARAKLIESRRPGTIWGEIQRSTAMFRSFSLTLTHLYGEEMMLRGQARGLGRTSYHAFLVAQASGFVGFLTLGGAVAMQLREIAKGNDPRPMDDPAFWAAAALQGGGLGIFGDFLYAAQARNGRSSSNVAAFGPAGQLAGDAYDLTLGNVQAIVDGLSKGESLGEAAESARIGRDVANIIRRYTPFSTNWMTRLAWERGVSDNLQRALDPDAEQDFARRRRRAEREGRTAWWRQGQAAPERGPDLTAALPRDDGP